MANITNKTQVMAEVGPRLFEGGRYLRFYITDQNYKYSDDVLLRRNVNPHRYQLYR